MRSPLRAALVTALALILTIGATACAGGSTDATSSKENRSSPRLPAAGATEREPDPDVAPDASANPADAFVEREEFFRQQGLPRDGSPLVAVTDAQKQFIAEQRAYVESQGGTWSAQTESLSLALAADACETSILNGHRVDDSVFTVHVKTSPVFASLVPADGTEEEKRFAEGNIASVMVFGTRFLCPADAPQWETAYTNAYGG